MKSLLNKKVIFLLIIITLIIEGSIYFSKNTLKVTPTDLQGLANNNCLNIPELPDESVRLVTKIIDGDTFLIEGGYTVRMLNIDADERNYPCYEAAKNRLEELILNKEVKLEKGREDKDQWCRYLRYVISGETNINLELVKEGLVVARFSPNDIKYRKEIIQAEKEARENKRGCRWENLTKINLEEFNSEFGWQNLTTEKLGLKVIKACEAKKYLGKELIVEGKIVDTFRSKTNTIFLNFEQPYPHQCFTAVIFNSSQSQFVLNPEKYYLGKTVRVRGKIKEYQGRPEIILVASSQIEIGDKNF